MATPTSLAVQQRRALDRLKPLADAHGLSLASLEDLAMMELSAIARRGIRRDFFRWPMWREICRRAVEVVGGSGSSSRVFAMPPERCPR